jgi:Flp pilus assembly pilin Flp
MWEELSRLLYEDDAMEMVEWSILGIVFALACVVFWRDLGGGIDDALDQIGDLLDGRGCDDEAVDIDAIFSAEVRLTELEPAGR